MSSGVTAAALNLVEKIPSENDKLTSLAMISEKTDAQSLSNEVEMKLSEDDLDGIDAINLRTSSTETLSIDSSYSSTCIGSGSGLKFMPAREWQLLSVSLIEFY